MNDPQVSLLFVVYVFLLMVGGLGVIAVWFLRELGKDLQRINKTLTSPTRHQVIAKGNGDYDILEGKIREVFNHYSLVPLDIIELNGRVTQLEGQHGYSWEAPNTLRHIEIPKLEFIEDPTKMADLQAQLDALLSYFKESIDKEMKKF